MNQNAYDVIKYMTIHLLLFLFKNVIAKWLSKESNSPTSEDTELGLMKQKLNTLKEKIREISPTNEYAKYTKMDRQINNLSEEIKKIESKKYYQNLGLNFLNSSKDTNKTMLQKIVGSYTFKFSMFLINIIEYFLLKNEYLEVDYEKYKSNIIVNHYYNEDKNKYYALIPVYRILICETIVLGSIKNLVDKII